MKNIRILQIGLGPLGIRIARFIDQRKGLKTIAAVDKSARLIGKDLGQLALRRPSKVIIKESVAEAVKKQKPDVALLTTVSDLKRIAPQIEEIVAHGIPVVSTCEELSFPFPIARRYANRINKAAIENKVAVIGTGVNPGYLMDTLPTMLTAVCQKVKKVEVNRFQDAKHRRLPFQKKIGAGLSPEEFDQRVKSGSLRHVGLTESIHMIAHRMKWKLDKTEDIVSPVIARRKIITRSMTIPKGYATGVRQVGNGYVNGELKIKLVFQATIGEKKSYEEAIITGTPNVRSRIDGGINGDVATCAIILNTIPRLLRTDPGLKTMMDIAPVSYFEEIKN